MKSLILFFATIFGIAGAYVPALFGDNDILSGWSILGGFIGGIFGIWVGVNSGSVGVVSVRYLVAVSGGVDSVVLLHKLVSEGSHELIVAHFDHGIRPESDADERFVSALVSLYGLPYEHRREELGPSVSEAVARSRRYQFLNQMAKKHTAIIVTAHHADDVIETIAINLIRGTGWRGLAVLDRPNVERPLLQVSKKDIYHYALKHRLEWVEDETNTTSAYLRNRVRRQVHTLLSPQVKQKLLELWQHQKQRKQAILEEERLIIGDSESYDRYLFTHIDPEVASELLRFVTSHAITRPQAERALHAIKTARAGTISEIGSGLRLAFTTRQFTVQTPDTVVS